MPPRPEHPSIGLGLLGLARAWLVPDRHTVTWGECVEGRLWVRAGRVPHQLDGIRVVLRRPSEAITPVIDRQEFLRGRLVIPPLQTWQFPFSFRVPQGEPVDRLLRLEACIGSGVWNQTQFESIRVRPPEDVAAAVELLARAAEMRVWRWTTLTGGVAVELRSRDGESTLESIRELFWNSQVVYGPVIVRTKPGLSGAEVWRYPVHFPRGDTMGAAAQFQGLLEAVRWSTGPQRELPIPSAGPACHAIRLPIPASQDLADGQVLTENPM
jgi:hypothetical protein